MLPLPRAPCRPSVLRAAPTQGILPPLRFSCRPYVYLLSSLRLLSPPYALRAALPRTPAAPTLYVPFLLRAPCRPSVLRAAPPSALRRPSVLSTAPPLGSLLPLRSTCRPSSGRPTAPRLYVPPLPKAPCSPQHVALLQDRTPCRPLRAATLQDSLPPPCATLSKAPCRPYALCVAILMRAPRPEVPIKGLILTVFSYQYRKAEHKRPFQHFELLKKKIFARLRRAEIMKFVNGAPASRGALSVPVLRHYTSHLRSRTPEAFLGPLKQSRSP